MDYKQLADILFPDVTQTMEDLEKRYPQRSLAEGAKVCRMAPSPTGFMHLGNLYGAIADERLAHQSGGVFYLRIEDTDQKRSVENGVETILDVFKEYELSFDEGAVLSGDMGEYGPYRQRQRADIYHVCAKQLVEQGKAYPCFLTEQQLADMRDKQVEQKLSYGCYGEFALYRDAQLKEIKQRINEGQSYVIRYRSEGSEQNRVKLTDLARGTLELPENQQDVVILKADGIPTYHFAHVVDDYFMRTNLVIRGEEWLATLPIHLQLFAAMGWRAPKYLHTAHLMKQEGEGKRKLSKRKDPELALSYYSEKGYTVAAVKEYLMSLLNSNFEDWRGANPDLPLSDFPFSVKKMGTSGALFDIEKLNDVSRNVISRMSAERVYELLCAWAGQYDEQFAQLLCRDKEYTLAMLAIGRGGKKPRKDLCVWQDAKPYLSFFFEELFGPEYTLPQSIPAAKAAEMLSFYKGIYDEKDEADVWFDKVKQLARTFGYADDMKAYKKDPQQWPGTVADVSTVLRLAVCGRPQSPDLAQVMRIMGTTAVHARMDKMIAALG